MRNKTKLIILISLLIFIVSLTFSNLYNNIPAKLIEKDIQQVEDYFDKKTKVTSSQIHNSYEGIEDMRNKIKSGYYDKISEDRKQRRIEEKNSNMPEWLRAPKDDSDLPKLSDYSEENIKNETINILKKDAATEDDINRALSLIEKYPNWKPMHTASVVKNQINYGMTSEQVAESWRQPDQKRISTYYSIWWYNLHWGKRDMLAFNGSGVLVYYIVDR